MIEYKREFIQAIERSQQAKLSVPDFYLESKGQIILNDNIKALLFTFLKEEVYSKSIDDVAFKCFDISFLMKESVESIVGCQSILTFGYIDYLGKSAFYEPLDKIFSWFEEDMTDAPKMRNIHVWLTLPTLEIIDISAAASFLKVNPDILGEFSDYRNCILYSPSENVEWTIVHRPQFVGSDFLYKLV